MIERRAHHDRVGLAYIIRLAVGSGGNQRGYRAGGRQYTLRSRAGDIRVGGDKTSTIADEIDGVGDGFKGIGAGFTKHHEIWVIVGEDPACLVHGGGQAGFAHNVGLAGAYLAGKKVRGSGSGGPDALSGNV